MTRALELAPPPSLLEAFLLGLDPAVRVAEQTDTSLHGAAAPDRTRTKRAAATAGPAHGPLDAVRRHWPEYLMEAAGLGLFMVSAGLFATLLWYPGSPIAQAVPDGM